MAVILFDYQNSLSIFILPQPKDLDMKMNIETIKDKNGNEYKFQYYELNAIQAEFFPKSILTFTVAFFNPEKKLLAIGIANSLFDFVSCVKNKEELLTKKT